MMTPDRWQRIEEVFQSVLDLAPEARVRRLEEACAGDVELRQAVEQLLSDDASSLDLLEKPAWQAPGLEPTVPEPSTESLLAGRRIGAYRLVRQLGRGGMGTVYLAERADGAFRQLTAVKLVKRGMDTDFILSRFRQERQILAALNHPYIARLLDGGATAEGLPYFVMEYVDGLPLYRFVAERKLGLRPRLELFCRVCEAVACAHASHVIHRDLKPSNVLVTSDGAPKLLDFGIAKLLNPDLATDTPMPTATEMRLMTPEYASPEQARGLPLTVASDVYAAGVMLYELVTGRRPYQIQSRMLFEASRIICEVEPRRPSTVVLDSAEPMGESAAGQPEVPAGELSRLLHGNLDNIILKALSKSVASRYSSKDELRNDLLAYLAGRPVAAPIYVPPVRPQPAVGHVRAIDDHAMAVLPLRILGPLGDDDSGTYLGIGLADTLITRLSQIRSFAVRPTSSVLRFSSDTDPFAAGREVGVRFVLDGNLRRAGQTLRVTMQLLDVTREATIWAQQFHSQADDVLKLEDDISAQVAHSLAPQLSGVQRQQLAKRGTSNAEAYQAYLRGRFYWNQFTGETLLKAKDLFETAVRLDPNYALAHVGVADAYNWAEIYGVLPPGRAYEKCCEAASRALELDPGLGEAHGSMALILWNGDWNLEAAERTFRKAIELNPGHALSYEFYGAVLTGVGRTEEGTRLAGRTEEVDPLSLRTKTLVAWQRYQAGRLQESLAKAEEIIEMDSNYPQGHLQRGNVLEQLGRAPEAVRELERCAELMGPTALVKYPLCFALDRAGNRERARRIVEEMLEAARQRYVKPWFLGMAHVAIDEIDAAFEYFEQSFAERDAWVIWFATEPKLERIHRDPRFVRLLRLMKNPLAERFASGAGRRTAWGSGQGD